MLKIALVCGIENGSPKVLAHTLQQLILESGKEAKVFYRVKALNRLLGAKKAKYSPLKWLLNKAYHFIGDRTFFSEIRKMDAVIICGWTPHSFYSSSFNVEAFKNRIHDVPVLYYAVQYLNNAPTIVSRLKEGDHALTERFDWHLSVSDVTEIRSVPQAPWSLVGMYLKSAGLKPEPKKEFTALIDFPQPGNDAFMQYQMEVLDELDIKYIKLEGQYSVEEIREIYKSTSIYFIQSREAYGLPIAECLACGSYVMTAESSWPMSWRLDSHPEVHGPGTLPECFVVYDNKDDLKRKVEEIRSNYDLIRTPQKVFDVFLENYPHYYNGNIEGLNQVFEKLLTKEI